MTASIRCRKDTGDGLALPLISIGAIRRKRHITRSYLKGFLGEREGSAVSVIRRCALFITIVAGIISVPEIKLPLLDVKLFKQAASGRIFVSQAISSH
ncbi:hypothetical protein M433DRAFT_436853 [Acidomyces richmondensis BFW]|nr:MAG: hypothetical protein FE78DRAFT_250997 [Acidomyces sp. 'richmondensis']KYG42017.1 hypothetical protein M433DRAFT_436853 [Acidomyces richmondensis BFW]